MLAVVKKLGVFSLAFGTQIALAGGGWSDDPEIDRIRRDENSVYIKTIGNWFVAIGGGAQQIKPDATLIVENGSGFPAPYNLDQYSTNKKNAAQLALEAGYHWSNNQFWFPAYQIGLRYHALFPANIGGQVTQYSLGEFTNYDYSWKLSSNVLLASAKLDLLSCYQLQPYFRGGVGLAINRASSYSETALANVTPRISPAFANDNEYSFAYNLGVGLDWAASQNIQINAGYDYLNMGSMQSGDGQDTWSGTALHAGGYDSHMVYLGLTYLIPPY